MRNNSPLRTHQNCLIENPNGTFSFVGKVSAELAYFHRERGGPLTEEESSKVRQCGPGLFQWCGTRTWKTRLAASQALILFNQQRKK